MKYPSNLRTRALSVACIVMLLFVSFSAFATPSTIIWIPSTDIQGYGVWHVGIDSYFSVFKKGPANGGIAFPTDVGLTVGVFPFSSVQMEVGVDILEPQDSPWLFNAKIGIPEETIFAGSPSLAFGAMNIGVKKNVSDYNIFYGLVSRNLPTVGRLSVGYFAGNGNLLVNPQTGVKENTGLLASWDKQMSEVSDKLWLAVDYQSGKSGFGSLNFGFAWAFTQTISVIAGYDIFHNGAPGTFTTQLDINL